MGTVENRKGHYALAAAIIAFAPLATNAPSSDLPAGPAPQAPQFHVRIDDGKTAAVVRRAIAGAYQRLGRSSCQHVFSDFKAENGKKLDEVLAAGGWTGRDYLSLVLFYDGSRMAHCNLGDPYAITQPGSRIVFICPRTFVRKQERNPTEAEALIIHEMLRSLGLGENPPSSVAITAGVLDRCD